MQKKGSQPHQHDNEISRLCNINTGILFSTDIKVKRLPFDLTASQYLCPSSVPHG